MSVEGRKGGGAAGFAGPDRRGTAAGVGLEERGGWRAEAEVALPTGGERERERSRWAPARASERAHEEKRARKLSFGAASGARVQLNWTGNNLIPTSARARDRPMRHCRSL